MILNDTQIRSLGEAFADRLIQRLGETLLPHHLAVLVHQPGYLDECLNEAEAARFLGVQVSTLQAWRVRGGGPRTITTSSRCVRYRRIDLLDWQRQHVVAKAKRPRAG